MIKGLVGGLRTLCLAFALLFSVLHLGLFVRDYSEKRFFPEFSFYFQYPDRTPVYSLI